MPSLNQPTRTLHVPEGPVETEVDYAAALVEAVAAGDAVEVVGYPGTGLHHGLLTALTAAGLRYVAQHASGYQPPIAGIEVSPLHRMLADEAAKADSGTVVLVLMEVDERLNHVQREALEHLVATLPDHVQAVVTTRYEWATEASSTSA